MEDSEVHLYSKSGEMVLTNEQYKSISALSGKVEKIVYFAQKSTVYAPFTDEVIARNVNKVEVDMKFKETKIFKLV
jgi:hypothetical protein